MRGARRTARVGHVSQALSRRSGLIMEAACGSRVSLAPAALRRGSARRVPAGRHAQAARASLHAQSAAEAAWPWLATSAGPVQVRAEAPPVTPRFMDGGGPTDPMALLMRQRIVFLGTQARRPPRPPGTRGRHPTAAFAGRAVQRSRRNGGLSGATLSPGARATR